MPSFLKDLTPFMEQERKMLREKHWNSFWRIMILTNTVLPAAQQILLSFHTTDSRF